MSYRHTSYRKMSAAVKKAGVTGKSSLGRSGMDRVLHWSNQESLPKPPGWGVPKARRAA